MLEPETAKPKPRLLFFYVPSDGRARRAEGFLAQVLQRRQNHDTFVVHRIDVAERHELATRLRVDATPALVVVSENKVRARLVNPKGCGQIRGFLDPWLR